MMRKRAKLGFMITSLLSVVIAFVWGGSLPSQGHRLSGVALMGEAEAATMAESFPGSMMIHPPDDRGTAPDGAAKLFKAKCAMCHALDGSGNTRMGKRLKILDLRSEEVQKQSDDDLKGVIAHGKGKMPKYEKRLSQEQIDQLVAYLRQLAKKN